MHPMERYIRMWGEVLTLEGTPKVKLYSSLKASTQATYSLGNRAYYFQGLSTRGGCVGDYLTRDADQLPYFIETIQPEPMFPTLQAIYIVQCNAIVSIYRESSKPDGNGNLIPGFEPLAEKVYAYKDTTTRSMKASADGLMDQSIYTMHIPHKFHAHPMDMICVYDVEGTLTESYRVESVGDTLTPVHSKEKGVDVLQLSEDTRPAPDPIFEDARP